MPDPLASPQPEHTHPHVHPHPHPPHGSAAFSPATPILSVDSVPASLAYYQTVLGFTVEFAWSNETQFEPGPPPTFAAVARGHCSLMLSQQSQGAPGMWLHIDVDTRAGLDTLYHDYQRSGARISEPPADRPWGRCEMRVQDLDGHTFRFSAPLAD